MDRRDLLKGGAATILATLGSTALAADHAHHEHHHHATTGKPTQALVDTAGDCIAKGEACLAHCLVLLGEGDKEMAGCARTVNQMLAICTALQKLAAQDAKLLPATAKLAADACRDCEKECRKHEKQHAECKACADACAKCLKACEAYAA